MSDSKEAETDKMAMETDRKNSPSQIIEEKEASDVLKEMKTDCTSGIAPIKNFREDPGIPYDWVRIFFIYLKYLYSSSQSLKDLRKILGQLNDPD